jgi:predicted transcriptional regulator
LSRQSTCITLYYMSTITVRLDKKLDSELRKLAKRTGRAKSDLIREALRRQLAITKFEELRQGVAPFAEARGWLTDEDVFHAVS